MVTHSQLKRLTLLMAGTGALVFGCLAGYAKYEAHFAQTGVEIWYQNLNNAIGECEKDRTSTYCGVIDSSRKEFKGAVAFRDERDSDAATYVVISVAIPIICVFLWFGGLWVVTGSAKSGTRP
jgi:hypothetical protein